MAPSKDRIELFVIEYANDAIEDVNYWAKRYKMSPVTIYDWIKANRQKIHEMRLAKKKRIQEKALKYADMSLDMMNEMVQSKKTDDSVKANLLKAMVSAGLPAQQEIEINDRQIDITITGINSQNNSKNKGDVSANNGKG